jgi:TolA-binding protein
LKAAQFQLDQEFRTKIKTIQKEHEAKIESLQQRLKAYQKEVAVLSKGRAKMAGNNSNNNFNNSTSAPSHTASSSANSGGGGSRSGSDSPS